MEKAHSRDSLQALSKLAELVDGDYRIVSQPPIVVPMRDLAATYGISGDETDQIIRDQFSAYRATLQDDRRRLLERFEVVDVARKVVGVGSVGTRAFIVLLQGRDSTTPCSCRSRRPPRRCWSSTCRRAATSSPANGWCKDNGSCRPPATSSSAGPRAPADRHYYWRQLRDMKGSAVVEAMIPAGLTVYARLCGWTLARAHARSGDPVAIAQYLGDGDAFDRSVTDFSARYADQNEKDFQAL